jgi:hypothetical protein
MRTRRFLLEMLLLAASLGLLIGLAFWFRSLSRWGEPTPEALVGKWVAAGPEDKDLTITFWRSGDFDLSATLRTTDGRSFPRKGKGVWVLTGRTLFLNYIDLDEAGDGKIRWQIHLVGDTLTCRGGQVRYTLLRAKAEPGQTFDTPNPPTFAGNSDKLKQTVIVPTLETPLPAGKSAIWCATLALAWQQMEKDVAKGPVGIQGEDKLAQALRSLPDVGLRPEDYYVTAGFYDKIVDRIRRELPNHFPRAPLPDLPDDPLRRFLAYAYLKTAIRYDFEFRDNLKPLPFKDSQGRVTPVKSFGILERDEDQGRETFRGQVRVLFRERDEFAVDLSRKTRPYQIVLARMSRKATLQATLDDLEARAARPAAKGFSPKLGDGAILLMPNMNWRIEHHFPELEGKRLQSPRFSRAAYFKTVFQFVQFKLDRRGAELTSLGMAEGWEDGAVEEDYRFDRPYLILMRGRGLRQPFFVMWVDNAELIQH